MTFLDQFEAERAKRMAQQEHNVISPDGFPITCHPFESKQAALDAIPAWCKRYEQQGYYSAVGKRIPLEELPLYLLVVPCD